MNSFSNFRNCISRLTSLRGLAFVCGPALLLLLLPVNVHGQAVSRINGEVTDQAGAVVPDAKVTVTNVDTNVSQTTTTTSAGAYLIIDLIPGTYVVKVEKTGFKASVSKNVTVVGGATSTVNATLEPGTVTETVEVIAPAIALQTEQPEIGTTVSETLLTDLPQIISGSNRQIDAFIFLVPGVTGSGFSHRINGGVDEQTEVMFNGVPEAWSETAGFTFWNQPPYDSIKDVDVLTGTFSAQYGLGQGVEQYRAKSGTNSIHGKAFFFYRNSFFDAPGAVNDVLNNGKPTTDSETNWGFSVGGPAYIPKLYNGRNKTFWYFSYDRYRQAKAEGPIIMPTTAEVGGDFSGLVNPNNGAPTPIFVPLAWASNPALIPSGCSVPASGPGSPGTQWPGNKIPTTCFSQVSSTLLKYIPAPNRTGGGFGQELNNFFPSFAPLNLETDYSINVDHNLTSKQAIHGWYWRQNFPIPSGTQFTSSPIDNSFINTVLGRGVDVTYSNAISPRFVVTGGVLYVFQNNDFSPTHFFPGVFSGVEAFPPGASNILPGINFGGGPWEPQSWGARNGGLPTQNHKTGWSILGNALWQHGRHTINFGVDIRKTYQLDFECDGCAGSLNFSSGATADPLEEASSFGTTPGTNTGNAFASFLLGNVDSANRAGAAPTKLRNSYVAPYFQDDMQVTSRVKVNWGLRWDLAFPFQNNFSSNQLTFFNPLVPNPRAISTSTGQPLLGGMAELGSASSSCPLCIGWSHMDMLWGHFSPRVGVTYQLTPKTVVLAGVSWYWLDTGAFEYGVNKVAVNYGNNLNGFETFDVGSQGSETQPCPTVANPSQTCTYVNPGYGQWDSNVTGAAGPLKAPPQLSLTPDFFNTAFPSAMVKHVKQAYNEQFIIGVQRELPFNLFLSVNGVHTHDVHLPSLTAGSGRMNYLNYQFVQSQCPPGLVSSSDCVLGQSWTSAAAQALYQASGFAQSTIAPGGCPAGSPRPGFSGTFFAPYATFGCDYGAGGLAFRGFLKFPQFRGITNNFDTNGADKYNALQASLQKRTGNGLTFLVSYTLSRYLSNTDSGFSTFNFKGLDPQNPGRDWSVGNNDQTHVLTMAGEYELPLGPGKKYLNRGGLAMKNLVGGWKLAMINWYESGTPINITACNGVFNCNPLAYTAGANPPNVLSGNFGLNWGNYYKNNNTPVFNTSNFSFAGAWTFGNGSTLYNRLRFPAFYDEDLSLKKQVFFTERISGEISMEYFNVLNRMTVGPGTGCGLGTNFGDSNFGVLGGINVPCQANSPRLGQAKFQIFF